MYHPIAYVEDAAPAEPPSVRPACLVAGCPCKDPRFVSRRRAAFHAALARDRGETAARVIPPEPGWRLVP